MAPPSYGNLLSCEVGQSRQLRKWTFVVYPGISMRENQRVDLGEENKKTRYVRLLKDENKQARTAGELIDARTSS